MGLNNSNSVINAIRLTFSNFVSAVFLNCMPKFQLLILLLFIDKKNETFVEHNNGNNL